MKILTRSHKKQGLTSQDSRADAGLLVLRLTAGGLMVGHGAQKLFGVLGGHGIKGTAGFLESLGLKPGTQWAGVAGASEFSSGLLTALGLFHPIGPIAMFGPMIMAWTTAHAGKPIWVTSGGAELPLMYLSNATALTIAGPGRFSLDKVLGIKVPTLLAALSAVGVAAGIAMGMLTREPSAATQEHATDEQSTPSATPSPEVQISSTENAEAEYSTSLRAREAGAD